jgi:YidC/Oxa1 family membrane protein insertase
MIDKKVILAFALSVAVFVLYSYFLGPKEPVKPPTPSPGPTSATQPADSKVAAPAVTAPAEIPAKPSGPSFAKPAKDITVRTKWYEAVFSERGGSLKSFKLTAYKERLGDTALKELIQVREADQYPLELEWIKKTEPSLNQAFFQADRTSLELTPQQPQGTLTFRSVSDSGITLIKTFTFSYDSYRIDLGLKVINGASKPLDDNLAILFQKKFPKTNAAAAAFQGQLTLINGKFEEKNISKFDKESVLTGKIEWGALSDTYFMGAIAPVESEGIVSLKTSRPDPEQLLTTFILPPINLPAGADKSFNYAIYFGPRDINILTPLNLQLEKAVNFGFFDIVSKPLLWVLNFFYGYLHNYGWAIILLTILVKIVFWPLTHKSYKSMKDMQKLQPKMAKIREKHKDNKEQMNQEMMALYKTYKVNPMGGCLPMVIQIPVFFALYSLLGYAIELRHAPFLLWITDLAAPDRLPIGVPIPYVGEGIPVLTLLMGASMFIQQKMTPTTGDPTQAKIMLFLPVVFTFMFINFAAGLVLYWLVNNVLSIGQQYYINKYVN